MAKFVRYGPPPRYGMPEAGFCASSFVIVRRGSKILAGVPKEHPRWTKEWAPNWLVYAREAVENEMESWRLPASYLYEGENPDEAAKRVARDQLRLRPTDLGRPACYAFYDTSSWYAGHKHYDLCFVYEVRTNPPKVVPPWWQRLEWVQPSFLRKQELGSAMGDLVRAFARSP